VPTQRTAANCRVCGGELVRRTQPLIENGRLLSPSPAPGIIRNHVLEQLTSVKL
jgi:hypothetical protein